MKMNFRVFVLAIGGCWGYLQAQPPPPGPPPQAPPEAMNTVSGSISQLNYGPDGRIEGFVLAPNTLVSLPPDWAMQLEGVARSGQQARVTGSLTVAPSGMQILRAATVDIGGKTLSLVQPMEPAPYTGNGVIRQLNYGPGGEVNGFVLENGMLARTPPFGTSDVSVLKPGASIAMAGFARQTASGRTVVEVQSITVNGQTIALNGGPGPDAGADPRGRRGPRGTPPPPPPAPPPPPER